MISLAWCGCFECSTWPKTAFATVDLATQLIFDAWVPLLFEVPQVTGLNCLCVGGLDYRRHEVGGNDGRPYALLGSMRYTGMVLIVWLGPPGPCVCAVVR